MRVYIEQTAQASIMKFVCDEIITAGSFEYAQDGDFSNSPLTQHLFQFPFVNRVFITANFVAIQKSDLVEWEDIAQSLKEVINSHLEKGTILKSERKVEPFTVYAEMTPNPKVMRFVANQFITGVMVEVKNRGEAKNVPIAEALFETFPFVSEVFLSENYISVTKSDDEDWQGYALEVRQFILSYLQQAKPVVDDDYIAPSKQHTESKVVQKDFTSVEKQIQNILEDYVQPAVANDGGNIALVEFNESTKTAVMLLQGACSGCPSSTMTLKNGIETILKEMLPNVVDHVEAING